MARVAVASQALQIAQPLAVLLWPWRRPHWTAAQFQAVHWMLRRERDAGPRPHPTVRDLTAAAAAPLFVCTATGAATVTAPPNTAHCRGGFFCDEPVRFMGQQPDEDANGPELLIGMLRDVFCDYRLEPTYHKPHQNMMLSNAVPWRSRSAGS